MFLEKLLSKKLALPTQEEALPGRADKMRVPPWHEVLKTPLIPPFPAEMKQAVFAMGCFWGVEKTFWQVAGVYSTSVGYAGGFTPNPTYEEVCTGRTGHTEVVLVVYDPAKVSYETLLKVFWENHDPTQGMRQGNDVGTQYRSAIYWFDHEQELLARTSAEAFQGALTQAGLGAITTELGQAPAFYWAEDYHQQYLHKNPNGYCGVEGTGVSCPIGVLKTA
jgi:peptide-methionine (S)-S-oxide reductase